MSTLQKAKLVKTCKTCKEEKSLFDFGKDKNERDGLNRYCKQCANKRVLETRISAIEDANIARIQLLSLTSSRAGLSKSILCTDTPKKTLDEIVGKLPEKSKKKIHDLIFSEITFLIEATEDKILKK
jgi:hypothetical protein